MTSEIPLYLALSCLQGRPMRQAAEELLRLDVRGLQLTPGNVPEAGTEAWLASRTRCLAHHGFSYTAMARHVWRDDGTSDVDARSVHPPRSDTPAALTWRRHAHPTLVFETMYPGYELGCGEDMERAMSDGLPLAVDVSHVFMQREQGVMGDATWQRLKRYGHVREVHLSVNRGRHDTHHGLRPNAFGLDWAIERGRDGVPVVLECYMHRMSDAARREQVAIAKGEA